MLGALVLLSVFLWDQSLQAWEGAALVASLFGAGFMMVKWSKAKQTRLLDQRGSAWEWPRRNSVGWVGTGRELDSPVPLANNTPAKAV